MLFPATMRLMGLLLIVEMVAGCGGESLTAAAPTRELAGEYVLDEARSLAEAERIALAEKGRELTAAEQLMMVDGYVAIYRSYLTLRHDSTCLLRLTAEAARKHYYYGEWAASRSFLVLMFPDREPGLHMILGDELVSSTGLVYRKVRDPSPGDGTAR